MLGSLNPLIELILIELIFINVKASEGTLDAELNSKQKQKF